MSNLPTKATPVPIVLDNCPECHLQTFHPKDLFCFNCDYRPEVRLWLDDLRDPVKHGCASWTWVKTADEAIALLKTGCVVEASLDHDLTIEQTLGRADNEKTGYTVVCWMESNNVWPPDGVKVHSMNPEGRRRMEQVIRRAYE